MQQPHGSWFLDDSSDGGPFRDSRPPRVDPDFPDPTPHTFEHPPQHQFPEPQPQQESQQESQPRGFPSPFGHEDSKDSKDGERSTEKGLFHFHKPQHQEPPPPRYDQPPPSGFRIPLATNTQFPPSNQVGSPPCTDADGKTPVFVGSAIFEDSVHPCKIVPSLRPPCRVAYGGTEREHHGRYDLLPISPEMEWVPTREGKIPQGRRPVEGGYESNGVKLFHALGSMDGVNVPGKTGQHLVSRFLGFHIPCSLERVHDLDREARTYPSAATSKSSENTRFCESQSTNDLSPI